MTFCDFQKHKGKKQGKLCVLQVPFKFGSEIQPDVSERIIIYKKVSSKKGLQKGQKTILAQTPLRKFDSKKILYTKRDTERKY